jgi:hypothetical protein
MGATEFHNELTLQLEALQYGKRLRVQLYGEIANESVPGLTPPELRKESDRQFRKWLQDNDVFTPKHFKGRGFDSPQGEAESGSSRDLQGPDENPTALNSRNNDSQAHNLPPPTPATPTPKRTRRRKRKAPGGDKKRKLEAGPPQDPEHGHRLTNPTAPCGPPCKNNQLP